MQLAREAAEQKAQEFDQSRPLPEKSFGKMLEPIILACVFGIIFVVAWSFILLLPNKEPTPGSFSRSKQLKPVENQILEKRQNGAASPTLQVFIKESSKSIQGRSAFVGAQHAPNTEVPLLKQRDSEAQSYTNNATGADLKTNTDHSEFKPLEWNQYVLELKKAAVEKRLIQDLEKKQPRAKEKFSVGILRDELNLSEWSNRLYGQTTNSVVNLLGQASCIVSSVVWVYTNKPNRFDVVDRTATIQNSLVLFISSDGHCRATRSVQSRSLLQPTGEPTEELQTAMIQMAHSVMDQQKLELYLLNKKLSEIMADQKAEAHGIPNQAIPKSSSNSP